MQREDEGGPVPAGPARDEYAGETMRVRRGGEPPAEDRGARSQRDAWAIRAEDTEPYVGLQYVARLFKIVAMVVIVALTAEVVAGIAYEGAGAILQLFTEVIQGGVLAAMLWGASDLTLLFIDVGHDVRAARVLLGRMSARAGADLPPSATQRRTGPGPEAQAP
ncbi:MAG TPA: hypothetical protein VFX98_17830 [Longimicrobiaceae bacterium]|nr:hypothetical protein [Longimicrobiaceae bacterium]